MARPKSPAGLSTAGLATFSTDTNTSRLNASTGHRKHGHRGTRGSRQGQGSGRTGRIGGETACKQPDQVLSQLVRLCRQASIQPRPTNHDRSTHKPAPVPAPFHRAPGYVEGAHIERIRELALSVRTPQSPTALMSYVPQLASAPAVTALVHATLESPFLAAAVITVIRHPDLLPFAIEDTSILSALVRIGAHGGLHSIVLHMVTAAAKNGVFPDPESMMMLLKSIPKNYSRVHEEFGTLVLSERWCREVPFDAELMLLLLRRARQARKAKLAMAILARFHDGSDYHEIYPSQEVYDQVLHLLAKSGELSSVNQVLEWMTERSAWSATTYKSLFRAALKWQNLANMEKLYETLMQDKLLKNSMSVQAYEDLTTDGLSHLIIVATRCDDISRARHYFNKLVERGVEPPDSVRYALLETLATRDSLEAVMKSLRPIIEQGRLFGSKLWALETRILNALVKRGLLKDALQVLELIENQGPQARLSQDKHYITFLEQAYKEKKYDIVHRIKTHILDKDIPIQDKIERLHVEDLARTEGLDAAEDYLKLNRGSVHELSHYEGLIDVAIEQGDQDRVLKRYLPEMETIGLISLARPPPSIGVFYIRALFMNRSAENSRAFLDAVALHNRMQKAAMDEEGPVPLRGQYRTITHALAHANHVLPKDPYLVFRAAEEYDNMRQAGWQHDPDLLALVIDRIRKRYFSTNMHLDRNLPKPKVIHYFNRLRAMIADIEHESLTSVVPLRLPVSTYTNLVEMLLWTRRYEAASDLLEHCYDMYPPQTKKQRLACEKMYTRVLRVLTVDGSSRAVAPTFNRLCELIGGPPTTLMPWTYLLRALYHADRGLEAEEQFQEMLVSGVQPTVYTFTQMLRGIMHSQSHDPDAWSPNISRLIENMQASNVNLDGEFQTTLLRASWQSIAETRIGAVDHTLGMLKSMDAGGTLHTADSEHWWRVVRCLCDTRWADFAGELLALNDRVSRMEEVLQYIITHRKATAANMPAVVDEMRHFCDCCPPEVQVRLSRLIDSFQTPSVG